LNETRHKLSVIVITRNEERNIADCLRSVSWAEDIILVDAQSTDHTVELARQFTSRIFVAPWMGYAAAKNFALEQAVHDWILWVDADERVPTELAAEIQDTISRLANSCVAYEVARRAYFLGKWIRHCGWYPGYVVRLFKKRSASFSSSKVHEHVEFVGASGRLAHDLLHYTDDNLFHYFAKFNRYTSLAGEEMIGSNRRFSVYDLLVRPPFLFVKMYLFRLGFLDGMHGLILSLVSAAHVFTKYAKLWELQDRASPTVGSRGQNV
jgi:glycosyltransferase involved in cell wall biosynthesis